MAKLKLRNADNTFSEVATKEYVDETINDNIGQAVMPTGEMETITGMFPYQIDGKDDGITIVDNVLTNGDTNCNIYLKATRDVYNIHFTVSNYDRKMDGLSVGVNGNSLYIEEDGDYTVPQLLKGELLWVHPFDEYLPAITITFNSYDTRKDERVDLVNYVDYHLTENQQMQPIAIDISKISWGNNYDRTGIITTEQFFNLKPYRDRVRNLSGEYMIYYIEETLTTSYGNLGIVKTIHYGTIQGTSSLQTLTLAFRTADHTLWDSNALGGGGSN